MTDNNQVDVDNALQAVETTLAVDEALQKSGVSMEALAIGAYQ